MSNQCRPDVEQLTGGLRRERIGTKPNLGAEESTDVRSWDQSAYELGRGGFTHNSDLAKDSVEKEVMDPSVETDAEDGMLG